MANSGSSSDIFDAAVTAEKLRVPVETINQFRRAMDPNLSYDEHDAIFPIDFGRIWDIGAFSAPKLVSAPLLDAADHDLVLHDWGPILTQFSDTLHHGLMGRSTALSTENESFLYSQDDVYPGKAHITSDIHSDGAQTKLCFKDHWQPPTRIILIARDVPPLTVFLKGFETMPWHLVDEKATEIRRQSDLINARRTGEPDDPATALNRYAFKNEAFIEAARELGKVPTFDPGHVIAITDRSLHAGRPTVDAVRQTWARAESFFIR